jgi:hypothetical protein
MTFSIMSFKIWAYFSAASGGRSLLAISYFTLCKRCRRYLGTMLPPSCRNWQLIYSNGRAYMKK